MMFYDWENLVMFIFPTQTEIKKENIIKRIWENIVYSVILSYDKKNAIHYTKKTIRGD